ncbi:MAG: hypothetical protein E3K32_05000 [wastewater metagenome]|nr:hypothetical protein [Candidatus Loosdrechtia aerotolerans]
MGKNNALGNDPLKWLKMVNGNKQTSFFNNKEKGNQQADPQTVVKQQASFSTNKEESVDTAKNIHPIDKDDIESNNTVIPKPKVIIGRLYEKSSPEKVNSALHTEGAFQGIGHFTKPSLRGARPLQPIKKTESETNHRAAAILSSRFPTYIIVAYTALMLILGYLVYNDFSKRTQRIEERLITIEKALHLRNNRS